MRYEKQLPSFKPETTMSLGIHMWSEWSHIHTHPRARAQEPILLWSKRVWNFEERPARKAEPLVQNLHDRDSRNNTEKI